MTVYWPNGSLSVPTVTSEYNPARRNPVTGVVQPHRGIDLVGFADNCSPVDGTVLFAGYNGAAGNEVRIRADGPTAFHVGDCFRMAHNARLYVSTGQRVKARQPVGRMGTTGQSTGVHCHFETHEWRLWNYVDPRDFMRRANTAFAGGSAETYEEDDMFTDEDRALLAEVKAKLDGAIRSDHAPLMDRGMFDEMMRRLDTVQGAPHSTRNDYGRVMDAGDLQTILNAIAALAAPVAPEASARIDEIAAAVADEIDQRQRERLGS